jgi:hypothetical protein
VTVELTPATAGTHLSYTEQYTLLEYSDDGQQEVAHLQGGLRLQLRVALPAAVGRTFTTRCCTL